MSLLTRRRAVSDHRIISPQRAIVVIALMLSAIAINWERAALRVGYAQGGLVAAFNFDEGAGSVVTDASGLGNHGVITGAAWSTTAKYGRALSFSNTNQFVTIADAASLDLSGAFTLEAWIRPSSVSNGRPVIVKDLAGRGAYALYANDASASRPAGWARINGVSTSATSANRLFTGVWTHLAATYNGTTLRLYVNGVSVASRAVSGTLDASDLPLRIGGNLVRGEYFRGLIDDVRVYNRSLTAQEIQADMVTPVSGDDTVAPQVAFAAPADGAALSSTVTLAATATDNRAVAGVQFYLDGAPLGAEDTTAPYTLTWDTASAANGAHLLTATAHDAAGNTASRDITVIVNNPPRLVILQPPAGATISGSTIAISYTTEHELTPEVHHVHFVLDSGSTRMDLSFDGTYQIGSVTGGVHTLNGYLARADHSKIAGSDATPVSFTNVVPDTAPPSVAVVLPAADATLAGAVIIRAEAADDVGVAGVQFLLDGIALGDEDREAPYEMAFDSAAAVNGPHSISARARDAAGNEAISATVTFTIANAPPPDTEAPSVAVTSPAANDTVSGSVTLRADATDNAAVTGVQFLLDGLAVGSEDTDAPYELAWDSSTVANGPHVISAMARDAAGNPGIAAAVIVTIENVVAPPPDTAPPVVAIALPVADATVSGAVILRADVSDDVGVAAVQFLLDGNVLGDEDAEAPFEMAWDSATIGNGPHTLSARARDAAGNTSVSPTVPVTVDNADITPPSVTMSAPAADTSVAGVVTLSANASDNVGIAGVQFLVDGSAVGGEDIEAPYDITWGSTSVGNGPHTISARARDAAGNTAVSAVNVTVANADITAPAVAIIAPAENATLVNVVTLSANALDNIGVVGVQFLLDGIAVGSEDTAAPFAVSWDSKTIANGPHTISARARDAAGNTSVSAAINVTIANLDITAPSVTITQPAANVTLVNVVALRATASDNIGVAGVQFLVDGAATGVEDTVAPYDITFDSRTAVNGPHTISARARDAAGNAAVSAAVNVTVANVATGPAAVGEWSDPVGIPVIAIHQALMPTGKVLMWDAADFTTAPPILWDPQTATFQNVGATATDLFCVGHAMLADGRLLAVGGDTRTTGLGVNDVNLFDPQTESWSTAPRMASRRWYPTATTLSDGRVFVLSGYDACYGPSCLVGRAEVYNPVANSWSTLPASANYVSPSYPFLFEMPDGRVIHAGSYEGTTDTRALDLTTNTWSVLDSNPIDAGSAVMYAPGKIMKAGKWANSDPPFVAAHGNTYVIDLDQPSPQWRATAPMKHARAYNMLTLLPDGSTLATAGSRNTDPGSAASGVLEAEIWSPLTETWTSLAPMRNPRMYHGSSMLLPDGRVLVAGSGRYGSPEQFNVEIYSPPYLFKGARPVIASAPAIVTPGQSFDVGTADTNISAVTLLRIGSMTHSFNSDQRFMSLAFAPAGGGLQAQVPGNVHVMIPGYYLLFLVNDAGVPSVGTFVRVPAATEDAQPPSAPSGLAAAGGLGQVSLTWTAATDNVAIANYSVHRSTVPGFVPSAATLRTTTVSTAFVDAAVAAGTYYYRVIARDAAGNESSASNQASAIATADVQPPTVAITAPLAGASVSGTVNIAATAADNVSIAGVRFMLDGVALGAEDLIAPYLVAWDTTTASAGNHQLTAVARDGAGNTTLSAAITVVVPAAPAPSSLVVALGFDEGSGTTSADRSGLAHNATLSSTTWTPSGKFGSALTFNGTSSWATVADTNALDLTNTMTLSAWVRPTSITGDYRTILLKEAAPGLAYGLYGNDGASRPPAGYVNTGNSDVAAVAPANLALNTWTHLTVTYNGAALQVYVNGILVRTTSNTGAIRTSTGALRIGGNSVWGEYFAGTIDEVRVYNRAISAAEIQTDMATPVGGTPPPPLPTISIADASATEGAGGQTTLTFAVTLSTAASGPVTASYATAGGSATTGVDYTPVSGTVSFAAGESTRTISVSAVGDTAVEPNETFSVTLSAPTGATLGDGVATGTIVNDDLPSDTTPPSVATRTPVPGATAVGVSSVVTAVFSESVAAASVTAGGFTLRAAGAPADVPATVAVNGATATLTPASPLAANTSYTATLAASIADLAGNVTGSSSTWTFTSATAAAPTGLVAAYAFNETTGTIAFDASGNGLSGALSGATWTPSGRNAGAVTFDGINDLVTVADAAALDLSTALTLEAWVYPAAASGWRTVVLKESANDLAYALYASSDVARPSAWVRTSSSIAATGPAALAVNTWSHVAMTLGGGTLRLYVNGAQVATAAVTGAIGATTQPLRMGGNSLWDEYFAGRLDDVRIYNRALTVAEIQTDMQTPVGGAAQPTYSITGSIAPATLGYGANLALDGAASMNTTADANGTYVINGLVDGTYTVRPTRGSTSFTPSSQTVTVAGGHVTGVNFDAAPGPAGPVTLVQRAVNGVEFSVNSLSVAFPSPNTAGNMLIITGTAARPSGTLTISDTRGNTYLPAIGPITDPGQDVAAYIWYVPNALGGANTVTLTPTSTRALELHVSEWSGLASVDALDQVASAAGVGSTASSPTVTTTRDGQLVFGYTFIRREATAGPGFTPLSLVNGDLDAYAVQPAAGPIAVTFTQTTAEEWFVLIATFRPASP